MVENSFSPIQEREEKISCILEYKEVCDEVPPLKRLGRSKSVGEIYIPQKDYDYVLLAHSGSRKINEFLMILGGPNWLN